MGNKFPWSMGARAGGPLLGGGGGGLPTLFDWNPELAEALPGTSTFTRASIKQVLTTTDGSTFWYQEAQSGEVPLDGFRREENAIREDGAYDDFGVGWNMIAGASDGGGGVLNLPSANDRASAFSLATPVRPIDCTKGDYAWGLVELSGSGTASISLADATESAGVSVLVTLSASPTIFAIVNPGFSGAVSPTATIYVGRLLGGTATSVTMTGCAIMRGQVGNTTNPPNLFDPAVTFNGEFPGVQYLNEANANTVNGSNVLVPATGTTITGGGYLPEPATTNELIHTDDLSDASWVLVGMATATDQGVTDIGLPTWRIDAGVTNNSHLMVQSPAKSGDKTLTLTAKAVTGQFLCLRIGNSTTTDYACFDVVGGTVTETGADADAQIEDLGNGWYDLIVTVDNVSGLQTVIALSDTGTPGNGQPSFVGANETFDIAVPQAENTLFPTSRIITSGSTVTRVADSLTDTTWPSEASAVIDTTVNAVIPGGTIDLQQNMLGFGDNSAHSFVISAASTARIFTGGINSFIVAASSHEGERHGFGMSFQVNEGIVVDDEDNDNTDVTGTPSGGTIQIGLNSALAGVPGNYHRIRIYAQIQSVEELKALA